MCLKDVCTEEAIVNQVLLTDYYLALYLEDVVTMRVWYSVYLLFLSLTAAFMLLSSCVLTHPEYFAYSLFDEWDSYDRLFERADRVLQGAGNEFQFHADDERSKVTESRGQRLMEELLREKPRHLPLLHRRWLQEARSRFGSKLHALLKEYEECGTNIQRVCLSETAIDLREVARRPSVGSDIRNSAIKNSEDI